jgi:transposase, IS5 family
MCNKNGAVTTNARIVLGVLIIKHHESLNDVSTIEAIAENSYMQYFLGLPSFKTEPLFAPSLFVEIHKRLGIDYWTEINEIIIKHNTPNKKDDDLPENLQLI